MTSSPSSFANTGKLQVLPTPTTLLFAQTINNNVANNTQNLRPANVQNGPILQQQINGGLMTTPTSIVRVNQPQTMAQTHHISHTSGQFQNQNTWNASIQSSPQTQFTLQKPPQGTSILHYTTVKNEPMTPIQQQQVQQQHQQQHQHHQQQQQPQQPTSILPAKVVTQPVIRQTVGASSQPTTIYTESQINDFVSKCRTFLTTLLRLAEKQAPEKLPMVRRCIQELLDGTIDPETFTQQLHSLYKSQPHTSLVPFFKLALPHMRQIVMKRFGCSITIDLLEKLQLPPSSNSTNAPNQTTNHIQMNNVNVATNPSLLSQTHQQQQIHGNTGIQQASFNTVQVQQKINLVPQNTPAPVIGPTGSLLSQQQHQQLQARAQNNIRPIISNLQSSPHHSLLNGQHQHQHQQQHPQQQQQMQQSAQPVQTVQPLQSVTSMIIQPTDNTLQRSLLQPTTTTTTTTPQTQIITVHNQPIKTETIHPQPSLLNPMGATQPKIAIKTEDEFVDDPISTSIAETRHLAQDDRLIPAMSLRRRFRDLVEKEKRLPTMMPMDDGALALVSHAAQERLKYLIEQVRLIAHHRIDQSMKNDPSYQQTSDVKSQIRFLEDLDKIEKQKKDKIEQEKIFRAAKSRSKTNDPEAAKLKQRAREMQQAQVEEKRQQEANETALAAIGKPKKRKLEESTNHLHSNTAMSSNGLEQTSSIQPSPSSGALNSTATNSKSKTAKRTCRANLRDLLLIMERDKYLKRTSILIKALNK